MFLVFTRYQHILTQCQCIHGSTITPTPMSRQIWMYASKNEGPGYYGKTLSDIEKAHGPKRILIFSFQNMVFFAGTKLKRLSESCWMRHCINLLLPATKSLEPSLDTIRSIPRQLYLTSEAFNQNGRTLSFCHFSLQVRQK